MNRLTKATYNSSGKANYFNLGGSDNGAILYDLNGNIKNLKRHHNGTLIDDLTFSHTGNRLTSAGDAALDTGEGFIEASNGLVADEYRYDANGNITKDDNKGLTDIDYNILNLPRQVVQANGDVITYVYDAAGIKLAKTVDDGSPETTYYDGPFHYIGNTLQFIQTAEGRTQKFGTSFLYEYNLTDHLGNVRTTVDTSGNVVQRDGYYPFGLTFNHSNVSPENDYKYNGFEEQKETGWYDYQARFYDPALGRFLNVDPAADLMRRHSVYSYAFNNPIRFIDPDGMMPVSTQQLADAQTYARGMMASAATDDENYQTDGYSELSHGQRSEVGDAGRYTVPFLSNKRTVKNPKNWLQRAWNVIRGDGYLNKAYDAKQKYDDIHIEYVEGGAIAYQISTIEITDAEGNLVAVVTANPIKAWGAGVDLLEPSEMDLIPTPFALVARVGTTLTQHLAKVGMTTRQASNFFGWGNKTILTKSVTDFTKKELLANGWTKQNLVKLARTYNDQIVKAQLKGAADPAAVVRRDQAMQLARHFFGN